MFGALILIITSLSACGDDPGQGGSGMVEDALEPDVVDSLDALPFEDLPVYTACGKRPVLFVHGINGSSANWETMVERLVEDGWPLDELYLFDAEDPAWGCNVDNAAAIEILVQEIIDETGSERVDIVAHSMGTISSRHFIMGLGGLEQVNTYVTLGGMHHGLSAPCDAPDILREAVCVWMELCESGEFMEQLNVAPATPGPMHWISMYGTADETVPNESSHLDGAENIVFEAVEHSGENGLLEAQEVYEEVRRVLQYPCW